jgi:hypothetical protein
MPCLSAALDPMAGRLSIRRGDPLGAKGLRAFLLCVGLVCLSSGCATHKQAKAGQAGQQHPNVFLLQKQLPQQLRKVAVLPLTTRVTDATTDHGRETLQPIYQTELAKTGRFELMMVEPDNLRQWTGRSLWRADDRLPENFFKTLREFTGCDAVLFAELIQFRPYQPLALGWNMKLIECREARVWWALDEVFDAGNPDVAQAAESYYRQQIRQASALYEPQSILDSPRRFGQYTISSVFSTLPTR